MKIRKLSTPKSWPMWAQIQRDSSSIKPFLIPTFHYFTFFPTTPNCPPIFPIPPPPPPFGRPLPSPSLFRITANYRSVANYETWHSCDLSRDFEKRPPNINSGDQLIKSNILILSGKG